MKVCGMRVGFRGRSFWPCRCASAGVVHKQEASSTDARLAKCKVGDGGAKKLDKSVHCGGGDGRAARGRETSEDQWVCRLETSGRAFHWSTARAIQD